MIVYRRYVQKRGELLQNCVITKKIALCITVGYFACDPGLTSRSSGEAMQGQIWN